MHVPGIIENGKVINHDKLFTVAGKQDLEFFAAHPGRNYYARHIHPLEAFDWGIDPDDVPGYIPIVIVKQWFKNGFQFTSKTVRGLAQGYDPSRMDEDLCRRVFEPTLH